MTRSDKRTRTNCAAAGLANKVADNWARAVAGSARGRSLWSVADGGEWEWLPEGLRARGDGWLSLRWDCGAASAWRRLENFVIEVGVSGRAIAAGLSFGPYKDFLVPLESEEWPRRLQLEIDVAQNRWSFRADGRLMQRSWWDAGIRDVSDLVNSQLHLKAYGAEDILFGGLRVHRFSASCRLSVVITCYRYSQRLRVSLRNWCHQKLPAGTHEIIVVNPHSPDGTHEQIAATAAACPELRVRELPVGHELSTNKGAMINRGVAASRGELIWLTDADCLFPADSAARVLAHAGGSEQRVFYACRRYLDARQTARLLAGELDSVRDFDELARSCGERPQTCAPWGYTQIAHRDVMQRIPYRELWNHYAGSDNAFVLDCQQEGIPAQLVPGLFCLHLAHHREPNGTKGFL